MFLNSKAGVLFYFSEKELRDEFGIGEFWPFCGISASARLFATCLFTASRISRSLLMRSKIKRREKSRKTYGIRVSKGWKYTSRWSGIFLKLRPFQILLGNFKATFRILSNFFVREQHLTTFRKTSLGQNSKHLSSKTDCFYL